VSAFTGSGAQQGSLYPPTVTQRTVVRETRAALSRAQAELVSILR
jgi:hypothetical protein